MTVSSVGEKRSGYLIEESIDYWISQSAWHANQMTDGEDNPEKWIVTIRVGLIAEGN